MAGELIEDTIIKKTHLKVLELMGLLISAIGGAAVIWGIVFLDVESKGLTPELAGVFFGLLGLLIGLSTFLVGRLVKSDPTIAVDNIHSLPDAIDWLPDKVAWAPEKESLSDEIERAKAEVERAKNFNGYLVFFFYTFLGMLCGFAFDLEPPKTIADGMGLLALSLPWAIIFVVGLFQIRQRGTFFGLNLPQYLAFVGLGIAWPILLMVFF